MVTTAALKPQPPGKETLAPPPTVTELPVENSKKRLLMENGRQVEIGHLKLQPVELHLAGGRIDNQTGRPGRPLEGGVKVNPPSLRATPPVMASSLLEA